MKLLILITLYCLVVSFSHGKSCLEHGRDILEEGSGIAQGSSFSTMMEQMIIKIQQRAPNCTYHLRKRFLKEDNGSNSLQVNTNVFQMQNIPNSNAKMEFPEQQAGLNLKSTCVCFSGGGNRALTSNMGQIRALLQRNILENQVGYLSSISGGSWASAIYQYYETGAKNDQELVGNATKSLKDLTLDNLNQSPPPLGETAVVSAILAGLEILFSGDLDSLHNLWTDTVGKVYLEPFGINEETYYTLNKTTAERIKEANPLLQNSSFYVPRKNRPFWIAGASVLGPHFAESSSNLVSLQLSPLYVGSPYISNQSKNMYESYFGTKYDLYVGGGFINNYAFGSDSPNTLSEQQGGSPTSVNLPSSPFTIRRAIGFSSDAPGYDLQETLFGSTLNPIEYYWPILPQDATKKQKQKMFSFADGGDIDGNGLIQMLQRNIEKIVVFDNSDVPVPSMDVYNGCNTTKLPTNEQWNSESIAPLFGVKVTTNSGYFNNNQVFEPKYLPQLICEMQKLHANGEPAVVEQELVVLKNDWWGLDGGNTVKILWYYLNPAQNFNDQLPNETKLEINLGDKGDFANFPNYKTVGQNKDSFIRYTKKQVNLLAAFTEWVVDSTIDQLESFLQD